MPQSAFHYCFDSRAELLKIVVHSWAPRFELSSVASLEQAQTARERIGGALHAWWSDVQQNVADHAAMFDVTLHAHYDPELADLGSVQYTTGHETVVTILKAAVADGKFEWTSDLQEIAVAALSFLDGISLRYIVDPENQHIPAVLESFADLLATLLKPTEPAVDA